MEDQSGPSARAQLRAAATARLGSLSRWWGSRSADAKNYAAAFVLTVLAFAAPLSRIGAQFGGLPQHGGSLVNVLLTLGQTLPLAVRTRWPAICLAVAGTSFALHEVLGQPMTVGSLGLYFALYSAGAHQNRHRWVVPLAATGVYAVFAVVLWALGSPNGFADYLVFYLVLAVVWGLGVQVRGRRVQEAERRRLSAQAAIAAERSRLARELHDVVTHHVTAMVVQAGAAQYLTASPDRVTEALDAISGTGRRALAELRFLLGVLEATGDSAPRMPMPGRVPDLVEQTRSGGQPVELVEDGEQPAMAVGAQLTAYRVVQEALTNAVKYAAGRQTLVRLAHTRDWTDVEVTTVGAAAGAQASAATPTSVSASASASVTGRAGGQYVSGGRGLSGLRERVEMLGGEFAAGPDPEGGFRVHARIPTGDGAA
ncbi:MAG: two-component sensor histidine kinase [Catenulispora sp.]|nr:two-component sensor histidine kinase [Catenulispora sp.]